jgi:hypothetical protein
MLTKEDIEKHEFILKGRAVLNWYYSTKRVELPFTPGYHFSDWELKHDYRNSTLAISGRMYKADEEEYEKFYEGKCRNNEEFEYILKLIGYLKE